MGFDERLLRRHFTSFFQLSQADWSGFLTNTLPLPQLMGVMLRLFAISPWDVRRGLVLGCTETVDSDQQSASRFHDSCS
jgi:lycopene beta-cyclase